MATPLVLVLPYMASIIGKKKGNKTYYYVATSGRVDGNPRITHQTYLGTAEHLARLVKDRTAPVPLEATARDCGLPAALWQAARRSGALDALLSVWPAPAKGPAIPHFLLLAAFHRICAPGPKTAAADWYRRSVLPDLWGFAPKRFSSQAFWDHFDKIDVSDSLREPRPDQLEQAQLALLRAFRERDLVSRCVLAYDTTNFPTWIATTNSRSALAQRGHNKQKRHDLRQIGLSYALDGEHGLSLGHHVYPGNVSDRDELPACLSRITRLLDGAGIPRQTVTLVLDKGSAALANTLELQASGLGWIAALPWGQAPAALRQRPLEQLEPLPGEPGVSVAGERTLVHGAEYLAVLRYSAGFASEQFHSVSVSLVKATQKLRALARQLSKPQDRHTEQGLRSRIERWLQPNFVATVLSYELQRNPDRSWELRFAIDTSALHPPAQGAFRAHHAGDEPARLGTRSGGRGLSGTAACGARLPRPEGRRLAALGAAAPLDRLQDPRACVLLPAGGLAAAVPAPPGAVGLADPDHGGTPAGTGADPTHRPAVPAPRHERAAPGGNRQLQTDADAASSGGRTATRRAAQTRPWVIQPTAP